jgi:hypothetical protein
VMNNNNPPVDVQCVVWCGVCRPKENPNDDGEWNFAGRLIGGGCDD